MKNVSKYLILLPFLLLSCTRQPDAAGKKVVVLAFDGMDPRIVRSMFEKGKLPNLNRLAREGDFRDLWSSIPPQSPVAWSNFITGMNPGGHAIFDFIHRDPKTYFPYLSMSETVPPQKTVPVGEYIIPLSKGKVVLKREGRAFWEYLSEKGIPVTIFSLPSNYPPVPSGEAVSGMGTPDLLGTYGTYQYFTTEPADIPEDPGGARMKVVRVQNDAVRDVIQGPKNTLRRGEPTMEIPFTAWLDPRNPVARIDLPGRKITLNQGEWSDWVTLEFKPAPLAPAAAGICRFFLKEARPRFRLYVSPLNVDPQRPALPIDWPRGFAREIADRVGLFCTLGMPENTKALTNNTFTTEEYYVHSMMILEERNRIFDYLFNRYRHGLFFFYYSSTDLGTHIFWHLRDPEHPAYDPVARAKLGDVVEEIYEKMDVTVGKVLARLDADTTFIVMSDHGFGPFYRNFHLNTWLYRNGYLALVPGVSTGTLGEIDWSRTRAYAIGFNGLYLNLRGREKYGIVSEGEERDRLITELKEKLEAERDPENGKRVIRTAHRREDIYTGPYVDRAPDLLVAYDWGYRTSWESALGDVTKDLITISKEKWSGDHCGATEIVPGVLFSNKKISMGQPHLYDVSPSILSEFGVPIPGNMVGSDVFSSPTGEKKPDVKSLPYL